MSAVGDFFEGLNAARASVPLAIEGPSSSGQAVAGEAVRVVLYASGELLERREDLAAAREWAREQGFSVIDSFEDDLFTWLVWNREPLRGALGVIAAGRADALAIPQATMVALSEGDRHWLSSALGEIGGRLETVPRARVDSLA